MPEIYLDKPVLMLHEIREEFFNLPLEDYILTFDDGLFSQYYYYPLFKKIPTQKIYFISSGIICDGLQSTEFPNCQDAHEKAFSGNKEDYMNLSQIKELMNDPLVTIGAHSHYHRNLKNHDSSTQLIQHIIVDTKTMMNWFREKLNFVPNSFCFPYNDDSNQIYKHILKSAGFTNFYGKERIDIQNLLGIREHI